MGCWGRYILKQGRRTHPSPQKSPTYICKRALYIFTKEPYIYPSKSPPIWWCICLFSPPSHSSNDPIPQKRPNCVSWRIHMCEMAHSHVWHAASFICMMWLIDTPVHILGMEFDAGCCSELISHGTQQYVALCCSVAHDSFLFPCPH